MLINEAVKKAMEQGEKYVANQIGIASQLSQQTVAPVFASFISNTMIDKVGTGIHQLRILSLMTGSFAINRE